jgi:hypothetical protein
MKPKTFLPFLCPWFLATASMLSTALLLEVSSFNREWRFLPGDHPGRREFPSQVSSRR